MQITSLKLQDYDYGNQWNDEILDHWNYQDFLNNEDWRKGWISFDCAYYNPDNDLVYTGITSFNVDIFKAYDRKAGKFVDLNYASIANPYDAKFHRSLVRGKDDCIYAAIALLHDVDRYYEAPGAAIVKYNPANGDISKLSIPIPHSYIQSIVIDNTNNTIYGQCFPPELLFSYNLDTGEVKNLGLTGTGIGGMAQGENIVLDDYGCVWTGWQVTRAWQSEPGVDAARICKYDPKQDKIIFYPNGLPKPDGSYGTEKAEAFFNFGDGFIYASGANGSLYRIDTETGKAEYLFTPTPDRPSRLASLVKAGEDKAFGITGRDGKCELLMVNYQSGKFEKCGEIKDEKGNALWQCHDIVMADENTLYVCENDNPFRSSYLWEIKI